MRRIFLLLALCLQAYVNFAQTTTVIYATGSSGTYTTGNSTSSTRTDGNIVSTSSTQRGYAVFNLSGIPAGSNITSCIVGYYVNTYGGSGTPSGWNTYAYAGDLSTVTTASTLFSAMTSGTSFSTATYGTAASTAKTIATNATIVSFMNAHIGSKVSICWTGGNSRIYTIVGETGAAATSGSHAPYIQITYTPPCSGTPAPGATNATATGVCIGNSTTMSLGSATTGNGVSYQWYSAPDVSGSPGTFSSISGANSSTYTSSIATNVWYECTVTCAYSGPSSGTSTAAKITALTLPASIGGSLSVCNSQNAALTDATSGGSWTSGNTAVATVNAGSGIVTGVSVGTAPITYTGGDGCIATATETVNIAPSSITVTPSTALAACLGTSVNPTASATDPPVTLIYQDFNAGMTGEIGGTWTVVNTGTSSPYNWSIVNSPGYDYESGDGTPRMEAYPDGITSQLITTLYSPSFSTVGFTGANLSFNYYCFSSSYYDAAAELDYSVDGGSTWTQLYNYYNTISGAYYWTAGTPTQTIALPAGAMGKPNVQLRWYYNSTWGFYWDLDNVQVQTTSVTVPSSGFTWAGVSGATGLSCTNCASPRITPTVAGNNLYNVTTTYATCTALTTVTVNAIAPGVIGNDVPVCANASVALTNPVSGGTWSASPTTIGTINSSSGLLSGVNSGTVTVSYSICGYTSTAVATVNPIPNTSSFSLSPGAGCTGVSDNIGINSSSLTAGAYTVNYTLSGANTGSGSAPVTMSGGTGTFSLPAFASTGSTTLVVNSIVNSLGCTTNLSAGNTVTIIVNNPPPAISGGSIVCAGSTLSLTDPSSGGSWTSGNTAIGSISAPGSVVGVSGGNVNITYTLLGCIAATNVTVNSISPITGSSGTCAGTTATVLDATTPGTWSSSDVTKATIGSTSGIITGVAIGTVYISYTGTVTGCSVSVPYSITPAPSVFLISGGGSYCAGGSGASFTLNSSSIGYNYQAYIGITPVGPAVPGNSFPLTFTETTPGTYTIVANPGSSCATTMFGSAIISINSAPNAYSVTGGGGYCTSATPPHVGLAGSDASINYQLYRNGTALGSPLPGTGAGIDFGSEATAGTYTVIATNSTTGCTTTMTGNTVVTINPLPTVYTMTGAGAYCSGTSGATLGLANSTSGISYQLMLGGTATGSPITSTGGPFSFPPQTTSGTYTIAATNTTTSCASNMSGSVAVTMNPLPASYSVSGGGNYCPGTSGVHVGLTSSASGVTYQLYYGVSPVGSPVSGTGSAIDFGSKTAVGTYTVTATTSATGCTNSMSGNAIVNTITPPNLYTVSGGGSFCTGATGADVQLSGSDAGSRYQLYVGATSIGSAVTASGSTIDFGYQTTPGLYTVIATSPITGCTSTMNGNANVILNPPPRSFAISGGGSFCTGGTGVSIGLVTSVTGVTYQLYNGLTAVAGASVTGTNTAISFGLQTVPGSYTVIATNTVTGCSANMTGSTVVSVNPLPIAYSVTGGGGYCPGSGGSHITLSGSDIGAQYQLYYAGASVGSPVTGTGSSLDLGAYTAAGTYTVSAISAAGCSNAMAGSTAVSVYSLPNAYGVAVGGGGVFCSGGTGVPVTMAASDASTLYQLYRNGTTPVGTAILSSGSGLTFGNQTVAGIYSVVATDPLTTCAAGMSNTVSVTVNPLPSAFTVAGGGNYCSGATTGVNVTLSGSATGISYQLYNGLSSIGTGVLGTGGALNFGPQMATGPYTVVATNPITSCSVNMLSSATVGIAPLPVAYTVTGGGPYCVGGTGSPVNLSSSDLGINYQLMLGATAVGSPIPGTFAAVAFGPQATAGNYYVIATDATSHCSTNMTATVNVSVTSSPTPYTVSGGGGYCPGTAGSPVGLPHSLAGMTYQLYLGGVAVGGASVTGSGGAITFGPQTAVGIYTISANDLSSSCSGPMTGSVSVSVDPSPAVYSVGGGGDFCAGGTGVHIILGGSEAGTSYQLMSGGTNFGTAITGTGTGLDFGAITTAGYYSVVATSPLSCINNMNDSAAIVVDALPAAYALSGPAGYCFGSTGAVITLSGSDPAVSYQLYNGSSPVGVAVTGTSASLSFGPYPATGVYRIAATNITTGCSSLMTGDDTVSVLPLPASYPVTGGGSFCAGGSGLHVGLSGSATGISYQLFNGTTGSTTLAGTGGSLDFGLQTSAGAYVVVATNNTTGCSLGMSASAIVNVNPLPTEFAITGGGGYCVGTPGVTIGLSGTTSGVSYQLYHNGTVAGGAMAGTGSAINFGYETVVGNYTVVATNVSTSCADHYSDSVSVAIRTTPNVYSVTASGTAYCAGGSGIIIYLSHTDVGVNYQLYRGGSIVGTALHGTGVSIDFGPQTVAGSYTVYAVDAASTGCSGYMSGTPSFVVNPLPTAYTVTGGGGYCDGGSGAVIGLSGSQSGVQYQLYHTGVATGAPVSGSGMPASFGTQSATGSYTVVATNTTTGCTGNMAGSASVIIDPLPAVFSLTGGGNYCSGGAGSIVGLSSSVSGTDYQLYYAGGVTGGVVHGTGLPISFGPQTGTGIYSAIATGHSTGCTDTMISPVTVGITPSPTVYDVTGGGNYCPGTSGSTIGLDNSATGTTYQLLYGGLASGAAVTGSGASITFGSHLATGTYTVKATGTTTGCTSIMNGSAVIGLNTLPAVYSVTGGGSYCAGGSGVGVGLAGSTSGISYTLYNSIGGVVASSTGTGSPVSFGHIPSAGTYTASALNSSTGCVATMSGEADVTVTTTVVPVVAILSSASDTFCQGTSVTFTAGPTNGGSSPTYVWKVNGTSVSTMASYSYMPVNGDVVAVTLTSSAACATPATANKAEALTVLERLTPMATAAADPGGIVCSGTAVTFTASAVNAGAAPGYAWIRNGGTVSTAPVFTYTPDNGDIVYCRVTSNYQCPSISSAMSNHITMAVDNAITPDVVVIASPGSHVASGQPVSFNAVITNSVSGIIYQWYLDGVLQTGQTSAEFTVNSPVNLDTIACVVTTDGVCGGLTNSAGTRVYVSNVGVQQVTSNDNIQLTPNPNKGSFLLKGTWNTTDNDVNVTITDMLGQVVYSTTLHPAAGNINEQVSMRSGLANGMYLLRMHSDSEEHIFHMVVEQ